MRIMERMDVNPTTAQRIPPPPDPGEAAAWERDLAILDADPRTAGTSPRPPWLVRRVLAEHQGRR